MSLFTHMGIVNVNRWLWWDILPLKYDFQKMQLIHVFYVLLYTFCPEDIVPPVQYHWCDQSRMLLSFLLRFHHFHQLTSYLRLKNILIWRGKNWFWLIINCYWCKYEVLLWPVETEHISASSLWVDVHVSDCVEWVEMVSYQWQTPQSNLFKIGSYQSCEIRKGCMIFQIINIILLHDEACDLPVIRCSASDVRGRRGLCSERLSSSTCLCSLS